MNHTCSLCHRDASQVGRLMLHNRDPFAKQGRGCALVWQCARCTAERKLNGLDDVIICQNQRLRP